jgi:hypothetical protein
MPSGGVHPIRTRIPTYADPGPHGYERPSPLRGHQFENMTVRVLEIYSATALPVVEHAIVDAPRGASISDSGVLNALKDGVKFSAADVKRVMAALERRTVVE